MLQFDGDMPRTFKLTKPEVYFSRRAALERLEKLFFCHGSRPDGVYWRTLPDEEDDRILLWELDPSRRPSARVAWAFIGSHWYRDNSLPGLEKTDDVLPSSGMSLGAACWRDDEYADEMTRKTRTHFNSPLTKPVRGCFWDIDDRVEMEQTQKKKRRRRRRKSSKQASL
jgi:hypothetical protein